MPFCSNCWRTARDCTARVNSVRRCDPAAIVFYRKHFVLLNGLVEGWAYEGPDVDLATVHLEADLRVVRGVGDRVELALSAERLGSYSITLDSRCAGLEDGALRMQMRQGPVCFLLESHRAIEIPTEMRAAIE